MATVDPEVRLRALARVTPRDPAYRQSCVEAIALAERLDVVSLDLENLLAVFIRGGPATPAECDAFALLAELYRRQAFRANALEAAQKLVQARPGDARAEALLQRVRGEDKDAPAPMAPPTLPPLPPKPHMPTRRLDPSRIPGASGSPSGPLSTGMKVAGRYELIDEIGRGGMSIVYRARDNELGEEVALKFLTSPLLDAEADARFKQELKLSRQLVHPNIVRLYDIGQHNALRFLSMELLSGMDLARTLAAGPLEPRRTVDLLVECCSALQAAHDRGIVHRDIKPANLFVTTSGELKVMDFGIAKLQRGGPALTSADLMAGTPAYLAPEQIRGFSDVSPAADLYSLGVVAFEMLAGEPPFSHPEAMALLMMHIQTPPPRLRDRNSAVPPALEAIVLRLLEKLPSQRFPSCQDLALVLEDVRRLI
jgi:eukaryotic-like serine/threonine-protein kinase